ncbi:MAG: zinc ribbon domain-containing protein [Syntrophobacteraceae bacterium]|nr:zinc ribbon domain-containing protein [Syntrophobacteraceae bacterium]
MPVYEYEHEAVSCEWGQCFEVRQEIREEPLSRCPNCGGRVRKIISRVNIRTPKTDSELRDLGFTKLVRRDDGVYENVTARHGESRYMSRNDPRSVPKLDKIIRD